MKDRIKKPAAPAAKPASNPLKKFVDALPPDERDKFARKAKTTNEALRVTAGAYRTGKLDVSPEFAGRLADASNGALRRAQLSPVCAKCPHAKRAD